MRDQYTVEIQRNKESEQAQIKIIYLFVIRPLCECIEPVSNEEGIRGLPGGGV